MFIKKLALAFFGLNCLIAHAQQLGNINGSLENSTSNEALPYATVALYSSDSTLITGTLADDKGNFSFKEITYGDYFLSIDVIGFQKLQQNITLDQAKLDLEKISLTPKAEVLEAVTVEGEKSTLINKVDRQVFKADAFHASQGGTAIDVIRNMPSVSVDPQGGISVRGASGFVVLIDGKPVQSDANTMLSQIPANAVEDVEIITTPLAKYDSEGKGGIINIVTKKGTTDGVFLQVNTNYGLPSIEPYDNSERAQRYGADFIFGYKKGKWNFSLGAAYIRKDKTGRREGNVNTTINDTLSVFPSDGERSFDEKNYSGRMTVGFKPNKRNEFNLGFYGGVRDKLRTADILYNNAKYDANGDAIFTDEQYFNENDRTRRGDFVLGSFDHTHSFESGAKLSNSLLYEYTFLGGPTTNLNLGYEDGQIQRGDVQQEEYNTNDNPLHGIRYQLDYQFKPSKLGKFEVGYQFRYLDHQGDLEYIRKNTSIGDSIIPEFTSDIDLKRTIHAAYAQFSGEKDKWSYGAGLRAEYMDRELSVNGQIDSLNGTTNYDFVKLFPSLRASYNLGNGLSANIGYSKRVERTTSFKMNPFREREHSETLEQGDKDLKPEFINTVEIGISKKKAKSMYNATLYYRHTNNLINRVNKVFNDTILDRIYSNVGIGRSWGMEVSTELKPKKWLNFFAGANLYNQRIKGSFDNIALNHDFWIYSINNKITFKVCKNTSIQFNLNYISERNTAQGQDSRYLSPNLVISKSFMDGRLNASAQWLNMDAGLLPTNEQRITTSGTDSQGYRFYTTTNYVYEVDMIMLNLSYVFNKKLNKTKFIKSEFGQREF